MSQDSTCYMCDLFADLLEYPKPATLQQAGLHIQQLREINADAAQFFEAFQRGTEQLTLQHMEELYTRVFDMQPLCYPYVGYHLFGESYKRGAFMAQLNEAYRLCNFPVEKELPDHISVVLRFLALDSNKRKDDFGRALLYEGIIPALEKMTEALKKHADNPYAEIASTLQAFLVGASEKELDHA